MADAQRSRCAARIVVTDDQMRWLDSRLDAGHEVNAYPQCELEAGHPGQHAALGQQAGSDVEWWLRWTTQVAEPEIVETYSCPVESGLPVDAQGERELCLLFEGHPGRHSFELI